MLELAIDIETFSSVDLKKTGVHKYAESPDFEVLLFGYMVDGAYGDVIDLGANEVIPAEILKALFDPKVLKTAYNAAFEIACLSAHFGKQLDASQWSCTQALAAQAGYPFGLDMVAKVMGTIEQKDSVGKALIKYFCVPCKPTKANGMRTRNIPSILNDVANFHKWVQFKEYCMQDVITEQAVRKSVQRWFTPIAFEDKLWVLDQKVNTRGVKVDMQLVNNALYINDLETERITNIIAESTGIINPNSDAQIKNYILAETGREVKSLNKEALPEVYRTFEDCPAVIELLDLRQKLSRSSIKKFNAMQVSAGVADRVRGLFQYYGANRTGRWAGRNVQLQNLKRNNLKDLDLARTLVRNNSLDALQLNFSDTGDVLSNLVRSAFIPSDGNVLVVSDFSAIEARVIAWLANEKWRMDVFAGHGKIYEASASMMFNIPLDNITKDLRQKGKVAELALGYGGGVGALVRMGGAAMGLSEVEMERIKVAWRKASPSIVRLWKLCNDAAIQVLTIGGRVRVNGLCDFYLKNNNLHLVLPSGRPLIYLDAKYNGKSVTYWGMDQIKKVWRKQDTYGGKLVENIVQAIARDLLAYNMIKVDELGYDLTMHVHDEIVVEQVAEIADDTADVLNTLLSQEVPWAKGLKLGAETFITNYYTK